MPRLVNPNKRQLPCGHHSVRPIGREGKRTCDQCHRVYRYRLVPAIVNARYSTDLLKLVWEDITVPKRSEHNEPNAAEVVAACDQLTLTARSGE